MTVVSPSGPPALTLVVLAYNEEANVAPFLETCLSWLDGLPNPADHEVLCIDDGSTDATAARAAAVEAREARVRLVRHETNQGMGAGMRSGFRNARGDYVTILAADGQVPPQALDAMLPSLARVPIVLTVYDRPPGEAYRVVLSQGLRVMMRALLGVSFRLEGIYLFPTHIARDEVGLDRIGSSTFFFSFELISRALALGYRAETLSITPQRRMEGQSKVANLSRIRRVAKELVKFRWRLTRERLGR